MRRIRLGWKTLRENPRGGVTLVVALCASALLLGLALSLIYSSGVLLARSNRKLTRERCYQLSRSLGQSLDAELRAYTTDSTSATNDTFYAYVSRFLDRDEYAQYDPDNPTATTYYYVADAGYGDEYGKVTIRLRKENPDEAEDTTSGQFDYDVSSAEVTAHESAQFIRYQVQIGATVELDDESYTYYTDYYRKDSYNLIYTWEGAWSSDRPQVYWNANTQKWYRDGSFTSEISPGEREKKDADGNVETDAEGEPVMETESVIIHYSYDTTSITQKIYQTTYESLNNQPSGGGSDDQTP